jgi:NAD-dependent deacetylase sirtuin 4
MQRTLLMQRALLRRRLVAMRSGSERIALDGSLHLSSSSSSGGGGVSTSTTTTTTTPTTPTLQPPNRRPSLVPDVEPISEAQLERLVHFVVSCPRPGPSASASGGSGLVVLTGAGASTEGPNGTGNGLPDYRGPGGAYTVGNFKPMTHQQFLASSDNRRRYWSRAFVGWSHFASAEPAMPHHALARLQDRGWVSSLVTQNVDRLHHKAGSKDVVELHGTTHEVVCLRCGEVSPRAPLQAQMAALNPLAAELAAARAAAASSPYVSAQAALQRRPDGDAEVDAAELSARRFVVPPCPACGAGGRSSSSSSSNDPNDDDVALKPNVVFFGDGVPQDRADRALQLASTAGALLVVGSSLRVWSAFRLVKAAAERGVPIAVLNAGQTRADEQLPAGSITLRLDCLAGEALARLERHPAVQLPASAAWGG